MGSRRASVSRPMPIQGHDSQPNASASVAIGRMRHNRSPLPTSCPRSLGTDPRAPAPPPPYLPHSHSSSATYPAHHPLFGSCILYHTLLPPTPIAGLHSSQRTSFSLSISLACSRFLPSAVLRYFCKSLTIERKKFQFASSYDILAIFGSRAGVPSTIVSPPTWFLLSLSYHSNTVSHTLSIVILFLLQTARTLSHCLLLYLISASLSIWSSFSVDAASFCGRFSFLFCRLLRVRCCLKHVLYYLQVYDKDRSETTNCAQHQSL